VVVGDTFETAKVLAIAVLVSSEFVARLYIDDKSPLYYIS